MNQIEEIVRAFKSFKILHPSYHDAVQTIKLSVRNSEAGGEAVSAMLLGDSGTGKTSVCEAVTQILGESKEQLEPGSIRKIIPSLYVRIPPRATIKSLAATILEALGSPDANARTGSTERRIHRLIITCRTRLIILDEFNNIALKGQEKSKASLCNWIKDLMDESRIPVCLSGITASEEIVDDNDQLPRRYPYRARLSNIEYSEEKNSNWVKILTAFNKELERVGNFQYCDSLVNPYCLKALYVHTAGNMSPLSILLSTTLLSVLESGCNHFLLDHLKIEASRLRSDTHLNGNHNVFHSSEQQLDHIISGKK